MEIYIVRRKFKKGSNENSMTFASPSSGTIELDEIVQTQFFFGKDQVNKWFKNQTKRMEEFQIYKFIAELEMEWKEPDEII